MNSAHSCRRQTPAGERPAMDLIESMQGTEGYTDDGTWGVVFADGSALAEEPLSGRVVVSDAEALASRSDARPA